jgi:two-component system, NarL family, response regulator DesR
VATKSNVGVVDRSLSDRERRVLRLAVQGRTNEEIARRVSLGSGSVKSHLSAAFAKLAADSKKVR